MTIFIQLNKAYLFDYELDLIICILDKNYIFKNGYSYILITVITSSYKNNNTDEIDQCQFQV